MKNLLITSIGIVATLLVFSCTKKEPWIHIEEHGEEFLGPNIFFFLIQENDSVLPKHIRDSLKLYYIKDGIKYYEHPDTLYHYRKHIQDPFLGEANLIAAGVKVGSWTGYSAFMNPNTLREWYVEFPDGDIDTLMIQASFIPEYDIAVQDDCRCHTPFTNVWYDGTTAHKHPTLRSNSGKPVFVLTRTP